MNVDQAARDIDNALPAALDGALVVKWQLSAEIIKADGEHSILCFGSPGISVWDKLGLLAAADVMSRQDMASAPDVGEHDE